MIDAWPKVRGERGNYPNPPFGSNGFAGARHRRIPTIRHPIYDADTDKPFSTYLTSHTFQLPLTKYIILIFSHPPSLWRPWLGETSGNTPPEVEGANQPNSPPERAQ